MLSSLCEGSDWPLARAQAPYFPGCLNWVASCWLRIVLCPFSCLLCLVQLSGGAVTEGEVRKCSCWVCTSQSRVGGENSSLLAGRRAGRDKQGSGLGEQVGEAGTQGHGAGGHGYLDTLPTCRWEVLGICIGSAGLPRLASCKCLLSPSDYRQAEPRRYVPRSAVRCSTAVPVRKHRAMPVMSPCAVCLEVPRSCVEVPSMSSPSTLRHRLSIHGSRTWG